MDGFIEQFSGRWKKEQVEINWDPDNERFGRLQIPDIEPLIELEWLEFLKSHPSAFAGDMARLAGYQLLNEKIVLNIGLTNYRDLIVINHLHPEIFTTFGNNYLANGVAVCAVVETSDGKIPLGLRSSHLAEGAGQWHIPGGNINLKMSPEGFEKPDIFSTAEIELYEELGIEPSVIVDLSLIGMITNSLTQKPDLIFHTGVNLNSRELANQIALAKDREEHSRWVWLSHEQNKLQLDLNGYQHQMTAAGKGALHLFLNQRN